MLIAHCNGDRIDAAFAERGRLYTCPGCGAELVLRRGRTVCPHFAHKARTDCTWMENEGPHHRAVKRLISNICDSRLLTHRLEHHMDTPFGPRRADVAVWSRSRRRLVVVEAQNRGLDVLEAERRSFSYAAAGAEIFWILILRGNIWEKAVPIDDETFEIEAYSTSEFERWLYELNVDEADMARGVWCYIPTAPPKYENLGPFWLAHFHPYWCYVEETEYGGGYEYKAKRLRTLRLEWPQRGKHLMFHRFGRVERTQRNGWRWPKTTVACFTHCWGASNWEGNSLDRAVPARQ